MLFQIALLIGVEAVDMFHASDGEQLRFEQQGTWTKTGQRHGPDSIKAHIHTVHACVAKRCFPHPGQLSDRAVLVCCLAFPLLAPLQTGSSGKPQCLIKLRRRAKHVDSFYISTVICNRPPCVCFSLSGVPPPPGTQLPSPTACSCQQAPAARQWVPTGQHQPLER